LRNGGQPISSEDLATIETAIAHETKLQIPAGVIALYAGGVYGVSLADIPSERRCSYSRCRSS
jgi:hypothetical protein